jgi:hypothetical protein
MFIYYHSLQMCAHTSSLKKSIYMCVYTCTTHRCTLLVIGNLPDVVPGCFNGSMDRRSISIRSGIEHTYIKIFDISRINSNFVYQQQQTAIQHVPTSFPFSPYFSFCNKSTSSRIFCNKKNLHQLPRPIQGPIQGLR